MKSRYITIVCLFLLLIAVVVAEQIFVRNTIDTMQIKVNELNHEVQVANEISSSNFTQKISEIETLWNEKEQILCLIVNHKDMENVGEQIAKLKVLFSQNDKQKAEQELELLIYYIDNYEHFVSISLQNLF